MFEELIFNRLLIEFRFDAEEYSSLESLLKMVEVLAAVITSIARSAGANTVWSIFLPACPAIAGLGEDNKPFICTMDTIGAKELEVWGLLYTKNLLDRELDFLKGNRLLGLSSPAVASLGSFEQ
ncbi:hypothetical protein C5167_026935 [Papaver somniferum]|nr:hypothetical protein C5167_026935 [Papaver somniferum]